MRRRTAMTVIMIFGILLTVCGVGYAATQFIEGGPPDSVKIGLGVVMAVIGIIVLVASARQRRRSR
ncbi:hypothetical protein GCM10009840_21470 [Pseudolysinimonas kribbensis]|uniref:DUF3185 family protein n=1 Tax=Pseudolysinimonas kribbensis TaxID=433641 RepID=A0ABQ6JZY0_9MICO|nr:hypothetical protein [Pseudolysinimonas kribbensis]GMA93232.1 hypothetical protein GCM10025881_00560 [Pseudolysinimonas kribbensis]GMA97140.1 hypothetical protein GCM10025881_39640 [Pseudolysinimonas kribbensis]